MKRVYSLLLLAMIAGSSGCAMCPGPYDYAYPAYGGAWERADRYHGRVGSEFTPHAGYRLKAVEQGVDEATLDQAEPPAVEVLEPGEIEAYLPSDF